MNLTDEELLDVMREWPVRTNDWSDHIDFARAAISAHMDKLIAECGVEPVGEISNAFGDLMCVSIPDMPKPGTKLYTADQLAAAVAKRDRRIADDNLALMRENTILKEQVDSLRAICMGAADSLRVGVAAVELRAAQDTFAPSTNEDVIVTKAADADDLWYAIPADPAKIFRLSSVTSTDFPATCRQLKFSCKDKEAAIDMYHEQGWELVRDSVYYSE